MFQHEIFAHQRLQLQLRVGNITHAKMMRAIELLGTKIALVVREEIGRRVGVKLTQSFEHGMIAFAS